jgi:hypothetical protein
MYEKRILKLQKMIAEIKQNFVMLVTKDTEDEQKKIQGIERMYEDRIKDLKTIIKQAQLKSIAKQKQNETTFET